MTEQKSKNKGGRPRKNISEEQAAQIEALAAYIGQEHIADYLGINRDTLHEIFKRQPEVYQRYKTGKSKAIAAVAQSLVKKARDGDTASMIFFLKTQAGWRETDKKDEIDASTMLASAMSELAKRLPD
jgi:hypothetical protein